MRIVAFWAVAAGVAHATPIQLDHQARVLDAAGGPLNGAVTLTVGIYPDGDTSAALWSEPISTTASDGYVSVILGADPNGNPLQDTVFDGSARYVGVALDGAALGPRRLIATVPSAIHAAHATNLAGGDVSVGGEFTLGNPTGSTCTTNGALRFNTAASALQVCDGVGWTTLMQTGEGLTANTPGDTCKQLKADHAAYASGPYWLKPPGYSDAAFETWCDMETDGGGWTLVGKVTGAMHFADDGVLDSGDTERWGNRAYLGDLTDLDSEPALGPAYESVPFTDFMLMGLHDQSRKLAWRHGEQFESLYEVFRAGVQKRAASVLVGNFRHLDYIQQCSEASGPNGTGPQFYGFNINSDSNGGDAGTLFNGYGHGWCSALAGWGRDNAENTYTGGGLGAYCYGRTHQMGRHYWGWGDGCNLADWSGSDPNTYQVFHGHGFFVR